MKKSASRHLDCDESRDSLSGDSLVTGPILPDIADENEECHSVLDDTMVKSASKHEEVIGATSPGIADEEKEECHSVLDETMAKSASKHEEEVIVATSPGIADEEKKDFHSVLDDTMVKSASKHAEVTGATSSGSAEEEKKEYHSALGNAMAMAKTRAEVAALFSLLPLVSTSSTLPAPFIGSPSDLHDSLVRKAQAMYGSEKKNGQNPSGIQITRVGKLSEKGLSILIPTIKCHLRQIGWHSLNALQQMLHDFNKPLAASWK